MTAMLDKSRIDETLLTLQQRRLEGWISPEDLEILNKMEKMLAERGHDHPDLMPLIDPKAREAAEKRTRDIEDVKLQRQLAQSGRAESRPTPPQVERTKGTFGLPLEQGWGTPEPGGIAPTTDSETLQEWFGFGFPAVAAQLYTALQQRRSRAKAQERNETDLIRQLVEMQRRKQPAR